MGTIDSRKSDLPCEDAVPGLQGMVHTLCLWILFDSPDQRVKRKDEQKRAQRAALFDPSHDWDPSPLGSSHDRGNLDFMQQSVDH